jgi:hypothetical protein
MLIMGLFNKTFFWRNIEDNPVKPSLIDYNIYFDNTAIENIPLELLNLGELKLSTGNIVACDPLAGLHHRMPFTRTVNPGTYPVTVCVAKTENSGDRYAIAKLEFSKDRAVRWELAITANEEIKELKEVDDYYGFPVDAGLGSFCDLETQEYCDKFYTTFYERNPDGNIYDDFFAAEFKKNAKDQNDSQDIGDWLNFYLPNKPGLNIIMFQSGYGDGVYGSYWGISDKNEICSLIIDFQVI